MQISGTGSSYPFLSFNEPLPRVENLLAFDKAELRYIRLIIF